MKPTIVNVASPFVPLVSDARVSAPACSTPLSQMTPIVTADVLLSVKTLETVIVAVRSVFVIVQLVVALAVTAWEAHSVLSSM